MTLIFDIGMHRGEDTAFYLAGGHRVVAVDADARLIEDAKTRFAPELRAGRLKVVHAAVTDRSGGRVRFHLSRNTIWSSLDSDISSRAGLAYETIEVEAMSLADLVREDGTPDYCKIDIEGADLTALRSLAGLESVPTFISVETECLPHERTADDDDALATLEALCALRYRRFKLVDQRSLTVLALQQEFYTRMYTRPWSAVERYTPSLGRVRRLRSAVCRHHDYAFPAGATGPFGDDLEGAWVDAETAAETLLFHRRDYFASSFAQPYGFWCDWHAAREG